MKHFKGAAIDLLSHDESVRNPASFFAYEGHGRFYKFFNSNEFVDLEKTFSVMRMSDVSKCFSSIYSHTLAWAVKDVQHGKDNTSAKTFANDFDALMRFANYNETNGIPVGAEVSRIFAEIILQSVEVSVLRKADREGLRHGTDFAMRRYIDDYVIFANHVQVLDSIQRNLADSLLGFNLHLNESKTLTIHRPLQTRHSQIISGASPSLGKFRESVSTHDPANRTTFPKWIRQPQSLVRTLVSDMKVACINGEAGYEDVSPFIIGSLANTIEDMIGSYRAASIEMRSDATLYAKVFDGLLSSIYYFFTVHTTVTSSYLVAKSTVLTVRFFKETFPESAHYINERVRSLAQEFILSPGVVSSTTRECVPIEMLNVILASSELPRAYEINISDIKQRLIKQEASDYYSIVSILFYLKDSDRGFLNSLEKKLRLSFLPFAAPSNLAHDCHLILDLISCPYLSKTFRFECATRLLTSVKVSAAQHCSNRLVEEMEHNPWFVNWDQIDLLNHLKKKELRTVY